MTPEFRRSTLTKLMKDHIGGNSRTVVLVTVAPGADASHNSIQAMRFGQRAMKVMTKSRINVALRQPSSRPSSGVDFLAYSQQQQQQQLQQQLQQFGINNKKKSNNYNPKNKQSINEEDDNNYYDQQQQQQQEYINDDPALEHLRTRMNKRRALVEVECALEEELLKIRRKIQTLENELSRSPIPQESSNKNINSNFQNQQNQQILTSDVLELKARELQHAISEESRIENDLFTLFDCPQTLEQNYLSEDDENENANNNNFGNQQQQQQEIIGEAELEAEECTLFAIVRKRHEQELNDVRAQAWTTTQQQQQQQQNLSQHNINLGSPPSANRQIAAQAVSEARFSQQPFSHNNSSSTINAISPVPSTSPSKHHLEKLLSSLHEELDEVKTRLEDREKKCSELSQRLLLQEYHSTNVYQLQMMENEESLQRASIELLNSKYEGEIRSMFSGEKTRMQYFGNLKVQLEDRGSFGERERVLKREIDDARREARLSKEENENLQMKLELIETERNQNGRESNAIMSHVAALEHVNAVLKTENAQLLHHNKVMKTHYEHDLNVHDWKQLRMKNDTDNALKRFREEGEENLKEMYGTKVGEFSDSNLSTTAQKIAAREQQQHDTYEKNLKQLQLQQFLEQNSPPRKQHHHNQSSQEREREIRQNSVSTANSSSSAYVGDAVADSATTTTNADGTISNSSYSSSAHRQRHHYSSPSHQHQQQYGNDNVSNSSNQHVDAISLSSSLQAPSMMTTTSTSVSQQQQQQQIQNQVPGTSSSSSRASTAEYRDERLMHNNDNNPSVASNNYYSAIINNSSNNNINNPNSASALNDSGNFTSITHQHQHQTQPSLSSYQQQNENVAVPLYQQLATTGTISSSQQQQTQNQPQSQQQQHHSVSSTTANNNNFRGVDSNNYNNTNYSNNYQGSSQSRSQSNYNNANTNTYFAEKARELLTEDHVMPDWVVNETRHSQHRVSSHRDPSDNNNQQNIASSSKSRDPSFSASSVSSSMARNEQQQKQQETAYLNNNSNHNWTTTTATPVARRMAGNSNTDNVLASPKY